MEAGLNCSSHCESGVCFIDPGLNSQLGWDVLQRLCALSASGVVVQSHSLSPTLRAVVWTLLSCGILLALFFLIFTLRFKNNRIVKMSSPNLNVLTLCGSLLTYSSGFLFAVEEREPLSRAVLQARMWTLCIGSSLVFGPILGKTWRLYRVFTQRVPDKRVIIRDIQLMGLVALLVLVDVFVLSTWGLTDPIKCSRSVSAMVKVIELDASYSLTQLDSCSSLFSDLWVILLSVLKGSLLLYGTYLAGLTSNVSLPPVNQSMTIMGAVCLVTMSTAVAVPISLYLYAWPNVVYSVVSGAIFICTMAINCLLFVPQLTQWRQFEEETNSHPSQMAKYFSSPSKSTNSMYSEDEIYYLLGENDSMKKLINEKNAVIDSLQEQVNNAKDKLLKLMTASHPLDEGEMDSSNTNLNSTSTQTTVVSPDSPTLLLKKYSEVSPTRALSPPPYIPPPPLPTHTTSKQTFPEGSIATNVPSSPPHLRLPPPKVEVVSLNGNTEDAIPAVNNIRNPGLGREILEELSDQEKLTQGSSSLCPARCSSPQVESPEPSASMEIPAMSSAGRLGFVTNEQLAEILQDLSLDAISSSVKSPDRVRSPSINPDDLSITLSPRSPLQFLFPTISPYLMRKRRPPFYSSRGGPPPYYFPGSVPPGRSRASALSDHEKLRDDDSKTSPTSNPQRHDFWHEGKRRKRNEKAKTRRGSGQDSWECSSHKCSVTPFTGQVPQPAPAGLIEGEPYDYSDSDSSSSEDYCYYQRSFCRACHHPYDSTDSLTSGTSDSEDESFYRSTRPVVNFKVDLKPTFV
ncbi:putative G-protein coupled receptor 156 [Siphateles boraxobius]|uniref:putative G-protein coupled receptor 156 n=1 Tax=Siphateles boraxobius TaxID=180520 RepID=UPI0040649F3A